MWYHCAPALLYCDKLCFDVLQNLLLLLQMQYRHWWPAEDTLGRGHGDDAAQKACCSCSDVPPLLGLSAAQSTVEVQVQHKQQEVAEPASSERSDSSKDPTAPVNDSSLDWQTDLLQMLLPKCKSSAAQQQPAVAKQAEGTAPKAAQPAYASQRSPSKAQQSSNSPFLYAGIFLEPLSRARLLSWSPPRHSKLSADHLTLMYRPIQNQLDSLTLGLQVELQMIYRAEDSAVQVMASNVLQRHV